MNISNVIIPSIIEQYEDMYERILPTGSRVICDPPVTDTDEDYLILVAPNRRAALEQALSGADWALGGSLPNLGVSGEDVASLDWNLDTKYTLTDKGVIDQTRLFHSWKRMAEPAVYAPSQEHPILNDVISSSSGPEYNLLVTCNSDYFNDFTRATFLCKGLNLTQKWQRVLVFEALTRDVWPIGTEYQKHKLKVEKYKSTYGSTYPGGIQYVSTAVPPSWWNTILTQAVNPAEV